MWLTFENACHTHYSIPHPFATPITIARVLNCCVFEVFEVFEVSFFYCFSLALCSSESKVCLL